MTVNLTRKQSEIVKSIFDLDSGDSIRKVDLCCGRGFGKSFLGRKIAQMALDMGLTLKWITPNKERLYDSFLGDWIKELPDELYKINRNEQCITWQRNGARLYWSIKGVTGSVNQQRDKTRGPNLHGVISDEEALGADLEAYANTLAAIRNPGPIRFYLTLSTPKLGVYKDLIESPGHKVFYGTSYDNPTISAEVIDEWKRSMSQQQYEREVLGMLVATSGQVWSSWERKQYPLGNIDTEYPRYNSALDYVIMCDFGNATGAYLIAQPTRKDCWTVVADYCPDNDANATRALHTIGKWCGKSPIMVIGGTDTGITSSNDGTTIAMTAKRVFGHQIRVVAVSEREHDKQQAFDQAQYAMFDLSGKRRLLMASEFVEMDKESKRGFKQLIDQDVYPDDGKATRGFLDKSAKCRINHMRDALLNGAVTLWPPKTDYKQGMPG